MIFVFWHNIIMWCAVQEEVEMEDVEEEPVLDIDACDRKDPLAVVEYIDDIYSFYKDIEVTIQFLLRRCCIINSLFLIFSAVLDCSYIRWENVK